ncbi:hypothetical protein [Gluconacetobacter johannae]|uniref:hypothetical protein n=1 Tax=Gluconacetobacter johannae TaxID=112140 RepID=UPI001FE2C074|nr:hypothetical protein [Gluconacetobacter johannae]
MLFDAWTEVRVPVTMTASVLAAGSALPAPWLRAARACGADDRAQMAATAPCHRERNLDAG